MNDTRLSAHPGDWRVGTLLARLSPGTRTEFLRLGVRCSVSSQEPLLREGRTDSHVVLLHKALTKVTATMADGRQALLAVRTSGDIVGEISALNGTPRSATVTTCRPSTYSIIHRDQFRSFLREHPDAAVEIAAIVAERLRWSNRRRLDFASYPIKVRLARILADLATSFGHVLPTGLAVGVRLTQPELATLCGAADATIEKALHELRSFGVVDTGYRHIVIRDMPQLLRLADLEEPAEPEKPIGRTQPPYGRVMISML